MNQQENLFIIIRLNNPACQYIIDIVEQLLFNEMDLDDMEYFDVISKCGKFIYDKNSKTFTKYYHHIYGFYDFKYLNLTDNGLENLLMKYPNIIVQFNKNTITLLNLPIEDKNV